MRSLVELYAGSVVKLVVSCQSTFVAFSFRPGFQRRAVTTIAQPASRKKKKISPVTCEPVTTLYAHPQGKHILCINMQMLADTQTHTFQLSAGSVQRLSQLLYRVSLSLHPSSVNSAAHWCRAREPDTHLLNRLARVFPGPASNSGSMPTLHRTQ